MESEEHESVVFSDDLVKQEMSAEVSKMDDDVDDEEEDESVS
jgi:hypothetical protein